MRFSSNLAQAVVITGLDAWVVDGGVHDVGLGEDDGAVVETIGEEVSRPEVGIFVHG